MLDGAPERRPGNAHGTQDTRAWEADAGVLNETYRIHRLGFLSDNQVWLQSRAV